MTDRQTMKWLIGLLAVGIVLTMLFFVQGCSITTAKFNPETNELTMCSARILTDKAIDDFEAELPGDCKVKWGGMYSKISPEIRAFLMGAKFATEATP